MLDDDSLASDRLKGVPEIARFLGEPERKTYWLLHNSYIPAGKLGATWIASKTKLRQYFDRITGEV